MTSGKTKTSFMSRDGTKAFIPFGGLGEYRLHTHRIVADGLGEALPFNCAVRNREELLTEHIELHLGEEIHGSGRDGDSPLLRFDTEGFWVWVLGSWFPLGRFRIRLELDAEGNPRVSFAARA